MQGCLDDASLRKPEALSFDGHLLLRIGIRPTHGALDERAPSLLPSEKQMNRPTAKLEPVVVALVATRGRSNDFLTRSIGSIVNQSRRPDALVFVDDSGHTAQRRFSRQHVRAIINKLIRVVYLKNERTPGPSGAWNTGLDRIHREFGDPSNVFVAVLDDDDEWLPEHIERCLARCVESNLHMTAPGIIRIEDETVPGCRQTIPAALDVQQLLATGQHIQGSNLFVRLDRFLMAGTFNENLKSCTDRDLVLNLALQEGFRFGATDAHTVRHFADARADRCSAPGSRAKSQGLTEFYDKWRNVMLPETRAAFIDRSRRLFGWEVPTEGLSSTGSIHTATQDCLNSGGPSAELHVSLVVGIIVDPATPNRVGPLLDQLGQFAEREEVIGLDILLLENGAQFADRTRLQSLVESKRSAGVRCYFINHEQQTADTKAGRFGIAFNRSEQRLPIAVARTLVSVYAAQHARNRPGSWVWLLDDDARLDVAWSSGGSSRSPNLVELSRLKASSTRIVYGSVSGAPPLPILACLRNQAIDAVHELLAIESGETRCDPEFNKARIRSLRNGERDYYYDLSRRDTRLLETPFPLPVNLTGDSQSENLEYLARHIPRVLSGEQVTRPLLAHETQSSHGSICRGPSALWFYPEDLLQIPNAIAKLGDEYVRRSDMLVAALSKGVLNLESVESTSIAVRQDRCDVSKVQDSETLRIDILGYALYSAVQDVLSGRNRRPQAVDSGLQWTAAEIKLALRKFRKYVDERCYSLSLSAWRLLGVAKTANAWIGRVESKVSVEDRERGRSIVSTLSEFTHAMNPSIAQDVLGQCRAKIDREICEALNSIGSMSGQFRLATKDEGWIRDAFHEQRVRMAELAVRHKKKANELRYLGCGDEGVVFTDEVSVLKVIDHWKTRDYRRSDVLLRSLEGRSTNSKALLPILKFQRLPGSALLEMPYVESESYLGGHGPGLVRLLRDCKRLGIVCRNVHPKNLRVSGEHVMLVDYGCDLQAYTDLEFRNMAKRCWLTWRWSHRLDLDKLMTQSLSDESMPELFGFDRLLACVDVPTIEKALYPEIMKQVGDPSGLRILDFGCGKGRLAHELATGGASVVAYDPDLRHAMRWKEAFPVDVNSLEFTNLRADVLERGPFDVVVASLVLCEIEDEQIYRTALNDISAALNSEGQAIIVVCNPFATFGGPTPIHQNRHRPDGVSYDDTFVHREGFADESPLRSDVHRPLHRLQRDLLRAGLRIESMRETAAIDLERFEPASDFLILAVRRTQSKQRNTSLIIKACPQEWCTIDAQVRHIVDSLQDPAGFAEHVLAIDTRVSGFPRQYDDADVNAFDAAILQLQRSGYIDRVVSAPTDIEQIKGVNSRWFGVDSVATHAANGQATIAFLAAVESCTSELIVQVDADIMICRRDRQHDWLAPIEHVLLEDQLAVTCSLSIATDRSQPCAAGPFRVETRASVLHRDRLLALRPLPNKVVKGMLLQPWHRALDEIVLDGRAASYRGSDPDAYFVHPPNSKKTPARDWMLALDRIEQGHVAKAQMGNVEWTGFVEESVPGTRCEPFVFIVIGRNVPPGRIRRCLESIVRQCRSDWGLVVVDDASKAESSGFLRVWSLAQGSQVTLLQPRMRRWQLANLNTAIRNVCQNPESVMVLVDLDDELIGHDVLDVIATEYERGADVTVGTMLRTDKHVHYDVNFDSPRTRRGGNVWQHLRTFKKYLFDSIPEEEMKIEAEFVNIASDWAFMLPIVERARQPIWIRKPLYLHEPSGVGKKTDREVRERVIRKLCERTPQVATSIERGGKP